MEDTNRVEAVRLEFGSDIYDLETLQKAALKFSNTLAFSFGRSDGVVTVSLTALPAPVARSVREGAALYQNEVLDQHLRRLVAKETEAERTLILAYAFSNTKLVQS